MPDISAIQNTPDVSFIDNKTIDDVRGDMAADFEAFMLQAAGSKVSLGRASVHRMILYSAAAQIYQAMQYVDRAGKQSLLKYSYSEFLDNLALLKGVTREPAKAATTTIRLPRRPPGRWPRRSRRAPGFPPAVPFISARWSTQRSRRAA